MPIPRGAVRAISFDYGHVLGGLDLGDLALRLDELDQLDATTGTREVRAPHGVETRARCAATMQAAMVEAYRAHDVAIAASLGHEAAWRALMATLVRASSPARSAARQAQIVEALWRAQPTRNLWRYVPAEVPPLLAAIGAAGIAMVVTSNSEGRAAELLAEVDLARHFVAIVDSGVIGVSKPDKRIFEAAAAKVGVPLSSIVHVGDSESADVVGAKEAGAYAIRFDRFVPGSEHTPTIADARAVTYPELRAHLAHALDRSL